MTQTSSREPQPAPGGTAPPLPGKQPTKLEQLEALLLAPQGAAIAELMAATGWQQHSVRGAMGGALKKRGLTIISEMTAGLRRYRASKTS